MNNLLIGCSVTINRRHAERLGREAERIAAARYEKEGFEILARRLKTPAGELDLIAAAPGLLIFVEVKTRRTARAAMESVSRRQQRRLAAAAEIVLAEHPGWQREGIRFDVALVVGDSVIRIEDAFRPGD